MAGVSAALSKAQCCDKLAAWDPAFIGWVRQYKGPCFADAWDQIDGDVDGFYLNACGNEDADENVDAPSKPLDDETLKSLLQWRELCMRPRK